MTEKKYIKALLIVLFLIIVVLYLGGRKSYNPENQRVEFAYSFVDKETLDAYLKNNLRRLDWTTAPFGTTKLINGDEKYVIVKIDLDAKLNRDKSIYFRFRNKLYEVYIDGDLIKRNGKVGNGDIYSSVTSYSEVKIPLENKYEGKQVIILIESPIKYDTTNIEAAEIVTTEDFFNTYSLFDIIIAFFMLVAMMITGLAALNIYWMRFNFGGKLYKVIIPLWCLIGSFIFDTAYVNLNYSNGSEVASVFSAILAIIGIFLVGYGAKKNSKYKLVGAIISLLITLMWIFTAVMFVLIQLDKINWDFAQYMVENILIILSLPVCVYCYIHSSYMDKVFVKPLKVFFAAVMIIITICFLLYQVRSYYTAVIAVNYATIYIAIALMILSSYIINTFHTNLSIELHEMSVENDVYTHIELSRESAMKTSGINSDEYNNFSIAYVESIIQSELDATSVILKEEPNNEVEVIYVENSFGNIELTSEEAKFYLAIYNNIFEKEHKNAVRIGKTIYLGFKQANLCYFMVINSTQFIGELKLKALNTYATGIKNNAQNYVITRYVEQARNDVIKSFGKTIESRVSSSNVIGITDKFVVFIARAMGKPEREVQTLKTASYIKNIGSIIMSEKELNDFSKMSKEEILNAYKRADHGYNILKKFDDLILSKAAVMARYQFESYDGSGHLGLVGEEIPDEGKIIKLAICMTSALREDLDIDNLFDEVMEYVERHDENVVSPKIMKKCKENSGIFDEIIFRDKEQFKELTQEHCLQNPQEYIY